MAGRQRPAHLQPEGYESNTWYGHFRAAWIGKNTVMSRAIQHLTVSDKEEKKHKERVSGPKEKRKKRKRERKDPAGSDDTASI